MKKISWLLPMLLIAAYCCNPVKKVIKDPEKTKKVVNHWLKNNPIQPDTIYTWGVPVIESDTTYSVPSSIPDIIDTASYHGIYRGGRGIDPAFSVDTMIWRPTARYDTITRTIRTKVTIRDTIRVNNALLPECQRSLIEADRALQTQKLATEKADLLAEKWRFRFWALITGLGLCAAVWGAIKIYMPKLPRL